MATTVPSSSHQPTVDCLPLPNAAKDSSSPDPKCSPAAAASLDGTSNNTPNEIAPSASHDMSGIITTVTSEDSLKAASFSSSNDDQAVHEGSAPPIVHRPSTITTKLVCAPPGTSDDISDKCSTGISTTVSSEESTTTNAKAVLPDTTPNLSTRVAHVVHNPAGGIVHTTAPSRPMPSSLSTTEVQEIITKRIQQCVNGCSASFSCGSSAVLPCAPMVTLLDDDGAAMGEPVLLHRPPFGGNNRKDIFKKQESQLEHLTSMMPRASFGKGGETVIDISIRDALQLDATKFVLNIPQETIDHILANIKVNLDLQTDVVAEQYSLNVYRTGGMFKKHKDTPRGDDMLGTLVLCLPTLYEGGCMKVTHGREVNQYFQRYSLPHCSHGSVETVDNRIEWCAFFSDVDHEILTVKEGVRVTAAYILRRKDNAPASECIPRPLKGQEQADRIRDSFLLGLRDDRFLSNGGKIGCACLHQYTNQQVFPGNKDSLQALDSSQVRKLKGNDLLIANAAVSAGLSVRLVPHLGHEYSCDGEGDFPLKKFPNKKKCPKRMSDDSIIDFFNATQCAGQLQNGVDIWILDMNVAASTSAGSTEWSPEGYFGNEASDIDFYVNACLIIDIPSYSDSRGVSRPVAIEVGDKPKAHAKKRHSEDSESSGDQSSKKKKKAKDPNAPKKNMSAWMHYSVGTRDEVKASQPELTFGEIAKAVSVKWKALSDQERAVWEEKAVADKERYQKELFLYKNSELALKWQTSQMEQSNKAKRSD